MKLRITWKRSTIKRTARQKATIQALGLRRLNHTVEHEATPQVRGMVNKVSHLLQVEEIND